jgi:hypothetical protein
MFIEYLIVFSLELITDQSKSAPANAEASQLGINISYLRGSGLGVVVMLTR